jgi:hypothetical protein
MDEDLVGTLMDAGMTPQDVRENFGEAYATDHDPGAPIEPVVRTLLTTARDDRQPPGPQVVVPSGVTNSLPDSKSASVVRVDTEDTYRNFRRGGGVDAQTLDAPENSESVPDMLNQLAAAEAGLSDSVDFQRGYASQWITGAGRKRRRRGALVGDIMTRGAASVESLFDDPAFSPDQTCLLCGVQSERAPVCVGCSSRVHHINGLFERGAASAIHDPNPTTRYTRLSTLVGSDFYRLQHQVEERATMLGVDDDFYRLQHQLEEVLGADAEEFYRLQHQLEDVPVVGSDFYRLQHQVDGTASVPRADSDSMFTLDRFVSEMSSLSRLSDAPAEAIPLSFSQPDADEHVATWKQGDDLYASIRVTGWDGRPRILTASTPYAKEVATVVGYATESRIPPSQTLAVLDPLARSLGASRLVPRLAASAPAVLRVSSDKLTPLVLATMPVTNDRVGR